MYTKLGEVKLKSGQTVEAGVVRGPDEVWADRVAPLLGHKGGMWQWQIASFLRKDVGVEPYFYILHRSGAAFSNIMCVESHGVGIFGHVFTRPEDRRQGATTNLMRLQMADFTRRKGLALYLATGFDSPPYHIYAGFGFKPICAGSGLMTYHRDGAEAFERSYFAPARTRIGPVDWPHWSAAAPLFIGDDGVYVRSAPLKMIGRCLTEGPILSLLRAESDRKACGKPAQGFAMTSETTGAVVGLSARGPDPTWPGVEVADVYCHRDFWSGGAELLERVLPTTSGGGGVVAYADAGASAKIAALEAAGFRRRAPLPMRVGADIEVVVFEHG